MVPYGAPGIPQVYRLKSNLPLPLGHSGRPRLYGVLLNGDLFGALAMAGLYAYMDCVQLLVRQHALPSASVLLSLFVGHEVSR